jgi:hypothetical protein
MGHRRHDKLTGLQLGLKGIFNKPTKGYRMRNTAYCLKASSSCRCILEDCTAFCIASASLLTYTHCYDRPDAEHTAGQRPISRTYTIKNVSQTATIPIGRV